MLSLMATAPPNDTPDATPGAPPGRAMGALRGAGDAGAHHDGRARTRGLGAALGVAAAAFAWWSTGLRPFTATVYVAIGIPVAALVLVGPALRGVERRAADVAGRPPAPTHPLGVRSIFPWITLLAVVAGLEGAGLALGGRSNGVPTLSTVADHALAWHGTRFVMFIVWLALAWVPTLRPAWRRAEQVG